ncbi:MAG: hypothetical protein E3J21_00305 [Anaerolineales bacterium]|nr:MAG: hypothetical protein E3J21_00305 [Anaerolineales bacterium]
MFVSEVDALVRQEQYKDLLGEAVHERLIRAARPRPTGSEGLYRKAANWLGIKMVRWGCNLLRSNTIPACCLQPQL